jgi:PAS domain S-box-containing protein
MINNITKNTNVPQILVVDDSADSLKLLTDILTNQGYQVRAALDGTAALKSVAFEEPDIILLDVIMKGMEGYEVCRRLKTDEKSRDIPVIFISTPEEVIDKVKGFAVGGVDYITKPFEPQDVLARVETHLRLRSLQRQLEERNVQLQQEIVDRKRTEGALRASEERYRSVVDHIGIGISLISPDMEILTLNNQMKKWFSHIDVSKRPVCYKSFNDPPREEVCSYCPTYKTLQDGQVHESITETPTGNEIRNYRLISSPVKDTDGKIMAVIEMVEDITENKKAQESLSDSENKYRTIFETTGAATAIIEKDTTISLINTEFEKQSGYSKGEVEGKKSWTEFVAKDDLARMQEYHRLRRVDPEAAPRNYEFQFVDGVGRIRDIFMTIAMIPGTMKSVISLSDITERKRMEEELKKERETFFTVLKNYPHGVALVDGNGVYQYLNPEFTQITGYGIEDVPTGRDWFQKAYPVPEYRQKVIDAWKADRGKTGIGVDRHFSITCKDGTVKDIEFRITFLENWSITVLNDITIRKRAVEALRESERRLSDIIDFLPDATFAVDCNGKIIAWNRAIEEMTGVKAIDMLGKENYEYALPFYGKRRPILIDLVFTADEKIEKKYLFIKKEGDILLSEAVAPLKGENRALWGKAGPLYDSRGNIVGAIESIRDITSRKRSEEALKKRERDLKAKSNNLEELNTALKVLLRQREQDKEEIEEKVLSNFKQLVMPYIEKLKKSPLKSKEAEYVNILESNLMNIISPFSNTLSSKYLKLTPKEIQVANLIKEGKTSKEIAELLNVSPGTVEFHRENIRNKLNIKYKKDNLRSYLLTLS